MIFFHRKTRLRVGLLAWLLVINLVIASAYSYLMYERQRTALLGGIDAQLKTAALALPEFLPADYHDRILGGNVSNDEYLALARLLTRFAEDAGVYYVYSFVMAPDGTVRTGSTSGSGEDWKENRLPEPGSLYEAPPEVMRALLDGGALVSDESDEFGDWRSFLLPARSPGGAMVVFGADVELSRVHSLVHSALVQALAIGLGGFVLSSVMVIWVTTMVTRDLQRVVGDSERIARFELDGQELPGSRIIEIDQLDRAMEDMKAGLRSFRKYVPADLVRELLGSGTEARLGSRHANLTLLFSDLENFTSMAESQPPESIAAQLGGYLGRMSAEIHRHRGTVDKFIGDAVMAFWGAPRPNESQIPDACAAALACVRSISDLNQQRAANGLPALLARFGIHAGPVVVGNLGSEDRLNYTAIGDTVNLASRLEGLNKMYGTTILVSEEVARALPHGWVWRPVDRVAVKGRKGGVLVCELLGGPDAPDSPRELAGLSGELFKLYERREWAELAARSIDLLAGFPNDGPASVLHQRAIHFLENPPDADWNGIWVLKEK